MATDNHATYQPGLDAPGVHAAPVTPNDSADLTYATRALVIGTAGDLKVTTVGGDTVTLTNVPAGVLPLRVVRVFNTGTTAADIAAIW